MSGLRQAGAAVHSFTWRSALVAGVLALGGLVLLVRAVQLQVYDTAFLNRQANARHLRVATIAADRGVITDRHGKPLAVSTPVDSVWVNPGRVLEAPERIAALAEAVGHPAGALTERLTRNVGKEFVYIRRHMNPAAAAAVAALDMPGVHLLREYRRYYPAGEVAGHLVGFTNVDDVGQEGLELSFENWLRGIPGKKRVLRDRLGRVMEDVERIEAPRPGGDLAASIDLRIQYLAYRELKAAVQAHRAASGSAVVIDVHTGEVLAIVNQPAYNPNDGAQRKPALFRNRAITDIIEPGSAAKPLIVAAALESGVLRADSHVDTNPGFVQVGNKLIEDKHNLGLIDLSTLLARSSNVGATKIAMQMQREVLWSALSGFGVGRLTTSGFPGESAGVLPHHQSWRPITQATLAYGYGMSMTPLQLAQAYATLAADGMHRPVSLVRIERAPIARRVVGRDTARDVIAMMEKVVAPGGSGTKAAVTGYRVAGKTGTARKLAAGGYVNDRYTAVFAGIAPVTAPRIAVVVVIDDPRGTLYYGGDVAAPAFSRITADALRILAIVPDGIPATAPSRTVIARLP